MQKIIFKNSRGQSIILSNTRPYILTKIENTGSPKTTILSSKAPGQDGKSYHGSLLEERILPITGGIVGTDIEDMYRKRQELCSVCNPKIPGKLIYINNAGEYAIDVVVEDSPVFKQQVNNIQEFLIQLYCYNPFWKDNFISSKQMSYVMGGLTFPLKLPTQFSQRSFKRKVINSGDVETPLLIEFYGPATNPTIKNNTTREFITIKRELKETDKLVINTDFGNKKVVIVDESEKETNVLNWIDLKEGFGFFQLIPGENEIEYGSKNDSKKTRVKISYRNRYVGV